MTTALLLTPVTVYRRVTCVDCGMTSDGDNCLYCGSKAVAQFRGPVGCRDPQRLHLEAARGPNFGFYRPLVPVCPKPRKQWRRRAARLVTLFAA